jgi:hypothetical protein
MRSIAFNPSPAEVKFAPEPVVGSFKPRPGLAPPLADPPGSQPKLALEFARPPEYPEATVTAVPAVSTLGRGIKQHQMLTIA